MKTPHAIYTALSIATAALSTPLGTNHGLVQFKGPISVESDSLHNVHIGYGDDLEGELRVVYGDCGMSAEHEKHHDITITIVDKSSRPDRLVWIVPREIQANGCLHAFSNGGLVGRSLPIGVSAPLRKRELLADVAETMGPWFDGVAYMQSKSINAAASKEAKSKSIAIVGGGMSGLMTSLLLESVGMHNWHIHESTQRVAGRVRTKYLNNTTPDQYQYQEMGPMRFPVNIKYSDTDEKIDIQDHKMVFQLGETLNKLNNNDPSVAVNFIPFIQNSPNTPASSNGYRLPDGRIPSSAQLEADPSLKGPASVSSNPEAQAFAEEALELFGGMTPDRIKAFATNVYRAHKDAVDRGLFHWSEATYIKYALDMDANLTDSIAGAEHHPMWLYDNVYFGASEWKTIDKGLSSLERAFTPLVKDKTTFGRKIEGLAYDAETDKVALQWREDPFQMVPETEEYDYAIVAVPFSKVRGWSLPRYSSLLTRAIDTMNYQQSCKIALHYKTRFWEKLDPPIIGGCGSVDIYGVGSVCYPSYNINSTDPGVLLAAYASGTPARTMGALSDADHVGLVQRAMVEAHGQIAADEYTGIYDRQCWEMDEHQAGAWAAPLLGQQELYLPAYFNTESKTIFVGEHTSYTHAWIFSALDSAVRGTTQLLLDLGLVDEAKEIVNTWMGRWIAV
ncbi:hypothetical protein P152DRAFT_94303 [Eremomyces bilateralis CBS 781.70]|uniref:Amine oxidase domain-containing protein n=1 Tax=Eremomyces bilateralis CBS 781.70 TaxID=1392243 RepID=A0A6G1FYE1_9PEZI|nr:uncharacterized protein P152DRAFT_94303 [Eremomyces bilateralis CBS 781.70]KAF1810711.1 hypothetical protein P152DRAFT_94303 [Eremomyces bilateralis CBS 781.70]